MAIAKHDFLLAAARGDLSIVQQYVTQPDVAVAVAALEHVLCDDQSICTNIKKASRTLVTASHGLWFCGGGEWCGVFRYAVANQQIEVLEWFFSVEFATVCPVTLRALFPHVARYAVTRNDRLVVETLLESWLFREAMDPETQADVLNDLQWIAHTHGHCVGLLIAHGANEIQ